LPQVTILIPDRISVDHPGQLAGRKQPVSIATEDHLSPNLCLDVADPPTLPRPRTPDGVPCASRSIWRVLELPLKAVESPPESVGICHGVSLPLCCFSGCDTLFSGRMRAHCVRRAFGSFGFGWVSGER